VRMSFSIGKTHLRSRVNYKMSGATPLVAHNPLYVAVFLFRRVNNFVAVWPRRGVTVTFRCQQHRVNIIFPDDMDGTNGYYLEAIHASINIF
jgi:hypothetical protein